MPTVYPADIRGLVTTLLVSVKRLPHSSREGRPKPPHNAVEGCAEPRPRPRSSPGESRRVRFLRVPGSGIQGDLLGDGPHEGDELARDGGDDDVGVLAACEEAAVALAEADLRLPGDGADVGGERLETLLDDRRDLGVVAVGPGGLGESATGAAVAGLGDAPLPAFVAARVFGGDEPDEGGELPGVVEAREVAELGDDGDGNDELDAAEGLQGLDDGEEAPGGSGFEEFLLDPGESIDLFVDGVEGLLEDDLLGSSRADDLGEVAAVGVVPVGASDVMESLSKEKGLQALLGGLEGDARGVTSAAQIADGLVLDEGDVDGGEIPGPEVARDLDGVASIGLHLVAGSLGDEGGGNDAALEIPGGEVAVKAVAAGAGFVGEDERRRLGAESSDHLVDVRLSGADRADEDRWSGAGAGGMGDRDRVFVDIHSDEKRSSLSHG